MKNKCYEILTDFFKSVQENRKLLKLDENYLDYSTTENHNIITYDFTFNVYIYSTKIISYIESIPDDIYVSEIFQSLIKDSIMDHKFIDRDNSHNIKIKKCIGDYKDIEKIVNILYLKGEI